MALAPSEPSESAFSESGNLVHIDRALFSDDHIRILVTLRSQNRFIGYTA